MVSFVVQKLINLNRSFCLLLLLYLLPWKLTIENTGMIFVENVLPMFSSRSFMVLRLLKSLSLHEYIFVCGVRVHSNILNLQVAIQLSQQHLLKRVYFLHFIYSCHSCQRLIDHRCSVSFLIPCYFFPPTAKICSF